METYQSVLNELSEAKFISSEFASAAQGLSLEFFIDNISNKEIIELYECTIIYDKHFLSKQPSLSQYTLLKCFAECFKIFIDASGNPFNEDLDVLLKMSLDANKHLSFKDVDKATSDYAGKQLGRIHKQNERHYYESVLSLHQNGKYTLEEYLYASYYYYHYLRITSAYRALIFAIETHDKERESDLCQSLGFKFRELIIAQLKPSILQYFKGLGQ